MQEDKEAVFDAVDTVKMCLPVFAGMLGTMKVNVQNMREGAGLGFTNATDAADWLVTKGVSFRDAHEIVGRLVLYCIQNKTDLLSLKLDEYKNFSDVFTDEIYGAVSLESCVNRRNVPGGTAKVCVEQAIIDCENFIKGVNCVE